MAVEGTAIRLGLVGVGKIARDQHIPAIDADGRFTLVATANPGPGIDGTPNYPTVEAMLEAEKLDAVAICTPPEPRHDIAVTAIAAGLDTLLEKPPAPALSKVEDMRVAAEKKGVTLFATWHVREAAGVIDARAFLAEHAPKAVRIAWRENIRQWHPGQEWLLGPGGFGCFDPGINALSVITAILPESLLLDQAILEVPEDRVSPVRAHLKMRTGAAPVTVEFDILQEGEQTWDIEVDTEVGLVKLSLGGAILELPGKEPAQAPDREYSRLYARFAELIAARQSEVDVTPLRLVADAFLLGDRKMIEPFSF